MSTIRTRHTVSGQIADTPEEIANHVVLGRYLEPVEADDKPYLPIMHKPREAEMVEVHTLEDADDFGLNDEDSI